MNVEWVAERYAGVAGSTGAPGKPDRSEEGLRKPTFPHLLTKAGQRLHAADISPGISATNGGRAIRTVRTGDTLSHLVQATLRHAGQRVSRGELYRAIDLIASANRLADPDRIRPGQVIDLSAITPGAQPKEPSAALGRDGTTTGIGESAAGILHGLKAFMQSFAGRFTSSFGHRTDPVTGVPAFHAGVDIKIPAGSLIYPAAPGRVIFSGPTQGYGNLVVLAHAGGFTTSYGHNASNLIPAGMVVDQEMPIAVVGATGKATGPHLHFELRKDGHPIDPNLSSLEPGDQGEQQDL